MSGTVLQFPLRMGLADDANKKSAPVSSLKRAHNVRWVRDGVIGKRFGVAQMGPLPEDSLVPARIVTRGEELSYIDQDGHLYTWSPMTGTWKFSGRVGEVGLDWTTLIDDESGVAQSDVVVHGEVLFHAYMAGDPSRQDGSGTSSIVTGSTYVQAIEWRTGRVLMAPRYVGNFHFIRVLLCGDYAVLIGSSGAEFATAQINSWRTLLDENTGVTFDPALTHLVGDPADGDLRFNIDPYDATSRFDAMVTSDGRVVLAYEATAGLELRDFNVADGVLSPTGSFTNQGDTRIRTIAITEDPGGSGYGVCVYCRDTAAPVSAVYALPLIFGVPVGSTAFQINTEFRAHHLSAAFIAGENRVIVAYSGINQTGAQWPETRSVVFNLDTAAIEPMTLRASATVMMTSGLFQLQDRWYVFARDANYGEKQIWDPTITDGLITGAETGYIELRELPSMSSYIVEVETDIRTDLNTHVPHRLVGKIDHDVAAPFQQGFTSRSGVVDGSVVFGVVPFQATASPRSFNFRSGLRLVTATSDQARRRDPWHCVTIGAESYLGSGTLFAWDGSTVFDVAMRTPMILAYVENSNDGSMADGVYLYQVAPGYRSHTGVVHRGPLSIVATVGVLDADDHIASAKLVIAPNSIDGKETVATDFGGAAALRSYFDIFRSEVGGSVLYERTYGPRFDVFLNQPTLSPQNFVDIRNDNDIAKNDLPSFSNPQVPLSSRPQPYTATGELEDVQPPAVRTMCLHLDRIFLVAGDGRTLWFSKTVTDNIGFAPGFNPDFVRVFDREVTALASHADRLIIFFERGTKYMVGDGPTVSNTDDRFSTPQSLQGEIGTTNPRSVVATPTGVFFQATGGEIYLLDGSLAMQWVGKDVRDQLAQYPIVTSAVHIAEHREVRFSCANAEGGDAAGILLVFDYQRGTWMTRSTPNDTSVLDAAVWDGRYVFASKWGIFQEDTTQLWDIIGSTTTYVPASIVLNPIAPSGPLSWHRIRLVQLIGRSIDPHNLTIGLARDFSDDVEQEKTWSGSSLVTTSDLERAQVAPQHQKMQAIEIHIDDTQPTYDTEGGDEHAGDFGGFELEGVALLVQTKRDLARIAKENRG